MENKEINYEYEIISKTEISDENWNEMSEVDGVKDIYDRSEFVEVTANTAYGELVSVVHSILAEDEQQLEFIIRTNIESKHGEEK